MKKKILIIDDHGHIRLLLSNRLSKMGFEVATSENAINTVKLVINTKPDLIVMDLMMPGIDGIQATKLLRENEITKNIPIIMLTAVSTRDTVLEALSSGVNDYVVKPFKGEELYKKIAHFIGEPETPNPTDSTQSAPPERNDGSKSDSGNPGTAR
jgi:DNA-binding response OmpR family regulator